MASLLLKFYELMRPIAAGKIPVRCLTRSIVLNNEEDNGEEALEETSKVKHIPHPSKDRRKPVALETSIRYVQSAAFKETYGAEPVWKPYRRNHKGRFPPRKTRKNCVRGGIITTGNPCPICRDEYLLLDHRNPNLLKQFISEHNGVVIGTDKTGLCRKQHQNLLIAIHRARDYGTITFDLPQRTYNYSDWYKPEDQTHST